MAIFGRAFESTIRWEGGYVNDPNDPGGATRFGISQRSYPAEDIKALTLERARFLYQRDYWDAYHLGRIENQVIANKAFDMLVNMRPRAAVRVLQKAVNYLTSRSKEIKVDGKLGPKTLKAINWVARTGDGAHRLLLALRGYHFTHYAKLVASKNTRYETFARGWLERALG